MRVWLALALLGACAVPAASAEFGARIDWCPARVDDPCQMSVHVWTDCRDALASAAAPPTYEVEFRWSIPGVHFDGPGNITVDPAGCANDPAGNATGVGTYELSFDITAPGERPSTVLTQFARRLSLAPQAGSANEGSLETLFVVPYHSVLRVEPLRMDGSARPGEDIRYDLKVTNLGNSQSYLSFELVGDVPEGWVAQTPVPITVQSLQQGASTNQVTVPFVVTAGSTGAADFTLRVTPSTTKGTGESGAPVEVTVRAEVRSASAPAADAPLVLLLAGLCAVLGRAWQARRV
jgi:hypothetical protein